MTTDARLAREEGTIVREPQSRVTKRNIEATKAMELHNDEDMQHE